MKITKEYKFEAAHIVRNCSSRRCSHTIHGHSYRVIVTIAGSNTDTAGMVIDFGLLKNTFGKFLDVFDHSLMVNHNDITMHNVADASSERVVYMPFNSSAENIALLILVICNKLINQFLFKKNENGMRVSQVQVFETATGSAIAEYSDMNGDLIDTVMNNFLLSGVLQDEVNPILQFVNNQLFIDQIDLPEEV